MNKIVAAACRIDHRHIFADYTHYDAFCKAQEHMPLTEEDFLSHRHEEGFVLDNGIFLLREPAFELAKANLQAQNPKAEYLDALEVSYAPITEQLRQISNGSGTSKDNEFSGEQIICSSVLS
jgi:hypothetical protein